MTPGTLPPACVPLIPHPGDLLAGLMFLVLWRIDAFPLLIPLCLQGLMFSVLWRMGQDYMEKNNR